MRRVCYDVGKRKDGPMALCDGEERGVTCTFWWRDVTCDRCLTMPLGPEATEERDQGRKQS